jgi:hypothetical protein
MKIQCVLIPGLFFLITACNQKKESPVTADIDPDIVLVNIENGDRAFIGSLIRAVDSCKPALIAIDAWFVESKEPEIDAVLIAALKATPNDIVGYTIDPDMGIKKSHPKFRSFISDEGVCWLEGSDSLLTTQPLLRFNNEIHESFESRIIKYWKPGFTHQIDPGQSIPIHFTRSLEQFHHYDINSVRTHRDELKGKVVILGFLGPGNESKHVTPLRKGKNFPDGEPDTYSAVIVANTIRTLLEYQ